MRKTPRLRKEDGYIYDHTQPMQIFCPFRVCSPDSWSPWSGSSTAEHSDFATVDDLSCNYRRKSWVRHRLSRQLPISNKQSQFQMPITTELGSNAQWARLATAPCLLNPDVVCFCTRSNPEVSRRTSTRQHLSQTPLAGRICLCGQDCSSDIRTVGRSRAWWISGKATCNPDMLISDPIPRREVRRRMKTWLQKYQRRKSE